MIQRQPISVSTLSTYIKQIFDAESMLFDLDVVGEISSYSISGKNAFFTIKDEQSILNCVLFNANLFAKPSIGEKVIVHGSPKYYVKGGKLNFNAVAIKPYGEGEIFKRFLQLKNKLEKEGLFDIAHKKQMPDKINRIGVITSETGAVIHDIINVINRRNAAQDIVLYPIKVQGIGADTEIAKAVEFFSNYDRIDAIIVGRGGGSEEDLSNFNSEIVARAVYNCKKFIVSAVGHETDFTLCDYVADLRAPTPSAAAELLTKDGRERGEALELIFESINSLLLFRLQNENYKLNNCINEIKLIISDSMQRQDNSLQLIEAYIKNSNPKSILQKGYAKIEKNNTSIFSVDQVLKGDNLRVYLNQGNLQVEVKEINKND